jgi:cell division protein FtsB
MPFLEILRAIQMQTDQPQSLTLQSKANAEGPTSADDFRDITAVSQPPAGHTDPSSTVRLPQESLVILEAHGQEMEKISTDLLDQITKLKSELDQYKAHVVTLESERDQYVARLQLAPRLRKTDKRELGVRQDNHINAETVARSLKAENEGLSAKNDLLQAQLKHLKDDRVIGSDGIFWDRSYWTAGGTPVLPEDWVGEYKSTGCRT